MNLNFFLMGITFTQAAQLILSLSILVVLHELGHFLPARWFGCRVEKFYLFFDYKFSLLKKKIGETEYGLGWIPFGGYVKISGMMDESMDKEQMKLPPQPYEMRSKKPWQRLIIMLGGIIINIILAIVIYISIAWHWGESYIPNYKLINGIAVDSLAQSIGLQNGDKIVSMDGKSIENVREILPNIIFKQTKIITVNRNNEIVQITVPKTLSNEIAKQQKGIDFVSERFEYVIDSIPKDVKVLSGNLQKGDRVIAFNEINTPYFNDFINARKGKKNIDVTLTSIRNSDTIKSVVHLKEDGTFGIPYKQAHVLLGDTVKKYTFFQSLTVGTKNCFNDLNKQISAFGQIFSGKLKAKDSLGSVFSMMKAQPKEWDWFRFWSFTGMLSIILAFFNLLPIPVLDGGHVLFILYEIVTGKKLSDKFMERALTVGFVLVMGLMVYALGLDIWRFFK